MARGRFKVVCSYCRKRKIGCDKKSPCTACVKAGNPYCDALGRPDQKSDEVTDALRLRVATLEKQLFENGIHPMAHLSDDDPKDTINFHDAISRIDHRDNQTWKYMGPFKWVVLVSMDDSLLPIFKSFYQGKERPACADGVAPSFYLHSLDKQVGLFQQPHVQGPDETLRMKLYNTLPSVRAIYLLIDRFFKIAYPYMPILDESDFRESISNLIGGRPDEELRAIISGNDGSSPAIYGILLVVLRISFITLTGGSNRVLNFCFHNSKEELDYLSSQNIGPDFIELANQCLSVYNVTGNICFEAFQLVVALRVYSTVGPETTSYDSRSMTLASLLNHMAYNLWLNRDWHTDRPDFNEKKDLLQKKLWYTLVFLDLDVSLSSGNLMSIVPETFDVRLPIFRPQKSSGHNDESEKMAIEHFHWLERSRLAFTDCIKMTGKVSGNVKISQLERSLMKLEEIYDDLQKNLRETANVPSLTIKDSFIKYTTLKLLLTEHYFLVGVYTHFMYHYIKKEDIVKAITYKNKVITKFASVLFPLIPELANQSMTILSGSTDIFICGPFIQCLCQCSLFIVSALVRFNHKLNSMRSLPDHQILLNTNVEYRGLFNEIEKHLSLLQQCNHIVLSMYDLMKNKYAAANRMSILTRKVTDCASSPDYSKPDAIIKNSIVDGNNLRMCNQLIEECLEKLDFSSVTGYSSSLPTSSTISEIPTEILWESGSLSPFEKYFDFVLIEEMSRYIL